MSSESFSEQTCVPNTNTWHNMIGNLLCAELTFSAQAQSSLDGSCNIVQLMGPQRWDLQVFNLPHLAIRPTNKPLSSGLSSHL